MIERNMHQETPLIKSSYLDEGSFGFIYKVEDQSTGELFALKCAKKLSDNYSIQREGEALQYLHSSEGIGKNRIITYYGLGEKDNLYVLQLELAKESLYARIYRSQERIPFELFRKITRQLLEGLQYLEEKRVIHDDIKPANILLNEQDDVLLADFGEAFLYSEYVDDNFSTLSYIPPEGVLETGEHGYEADVWSVACSVAEIPLREILFYNPAPQEDLLHQGIEFRGRLLIWHQNRLEERYPRELIAKSSDRGKQLLGLKFILDQELKSWQQRLLSEALHSCNQTTSLEEAIREGYATHFPDNMGDVEAFISLMGKMLKFDPRERMHAGQLLEDPFFQNLSLVKERL